MRLTPQNTPIPAGTANSQTLRWNGTTSTWVTAGNLTNDGTNIVMGTTSLGATLYVLGGDLVINNAASLKGHDVAGAPTVLCCLDSANNYNARNNASAGNAYYGISGYGGNTTGVTYFQTNDGNAAVQDAQGRWGIGVTASLEGQLHVRSADASRSVLTLDMAPSQSDNPLRVRDSSGTDIFNVDAYGSVVLNGITASGGATFTDNVSTSGILSGGEVDGPSFYSTTTFFEVSQPAQFDSDVTITGNANFSNILSTSNFYDNGPNSANVGFFTGTGFSNDYNVDINGTLLVEGDTNLHSLAIGSTGTQITSTGDIQGAGNVTASGLIGVHYSADQTQGVTENVTIGGVTLHYKNGVYVGHT